MFPDPSPNSATPHNLFFSLNNACQAFFTRDLADYLALFLILILGLFRLDAVLKRVNIGIRMTRDVGTETDDQELETFSSNPVDILLDDIDIRNVRDFGCNTTQVEVMDQECNTETSSMPIVFVVTAPSESHFTESGTNTDSGGLFSKQMTLVSECTQTNGVNGHRIRAAMSGRSKIPVLLKTLPISRSQSNSLSKVNSFSSGTSSSTQSILELSLSVGMGATPSPSSSGEIVRFCQSSSSSSSQSDSDPFPLLPPTKRIQTPNVPLLDSPKTNNPKPTPRSEEQDLNVKKSNSWAERYTYYDAIIKNDVLLRSPTPITAPTPSHPIQKSPPIQETESDTVTTIRSRRNSLTERSRENSVVERSNYNRHRNSVIERTTVSRTPVVERKWNSMGTPKLAKRVMRSKSFGGELISEYNENESFVFHPRPRHSSNRRLFRVSYVEGS